MADEEQHVLIQALPPTSDYITYLTLVEHNLNLESLPVLHQVLQDTDLTINIGWDLVHLLLPLLPASEQCLQDVARLGNPREVVLKVTESLRLLEFPESEEPSDDDEDSAVLATHPGPSDGGAGPSKPDLVEPELPLPVLEFQSLLSMLSILHPRIKTKYPSRFLSTSLQAVLAAYPRSEQNNDEITHAVVTFVKTLSGTRRPHLPSRRSSGQLLSGFPSRSAPDPEADPESNDSSPEDSALQNRLLQSFITHVLEDYMLSLKSTGETPGLSWTSRLQEKLNPERTVLGPGKSTSAEKFATDETLQGRTATIGQLVALAQDLDLKSDELYAVITDVSQEATGEPSKEDEPPASAADIPLSKAGALFLFTARQVSEKLYDSTSKTQAMPIFPDHATVLQNFIGTASPATIGLESEQLIDAVLVLGLMAIENDDVGEPVNDEHFAQYLQATSLLSANTPVPTLRYHAHYLTSTILRSHPSDLVRLSFIRDTLEHCPYENLKASAVGWLKGETIEANPSHPHSHPHGASGSSSSTYQHSTAEASEADSPSIFATPIALSTMSPFLFPDLTHDLPSTSAPEAWTHFKMNFSFYLATLNFYYLLLLAKHLHEPLGLARLHETSDFGGSYLGPLRDASARFKTGLGEGGELRNIEDGDVTTAMMDLMILDDALGKVEGAVANLNAS